MATPAESPSPASFNKEPASLIGPCSSSSQLFSPSSDKCFWSTLRSRVDSLLENRKLGDRSLTADMETGATDRSKRLKEDSMLLLRGFDSVAQSLSQLSHSLDNAVQGARKLRGPPTLTEIVIASCDKAGANEQDSTKRRGNAENRRLKRKLESKECYNDTSQENLHKAEDESSKEMDGIKEVKTLAIAMAAKASSLAREMKSIQSDLGIMQERCTLLEEENAKLRQGLVKVIPPDEDDLVRLQLEALLAEKSRLANENANLKRENQSLHQLVEYHQLTSQDLSETYDNLVAGLCLDFSSPVENDDDPQNRTLSLRTPQVDVSGFAKSFMNALNDKE